MRILLKSRAELVKLILCYVRARMLTFVAASGIANSMDASWLVNPS